MVILMIFEFIVENCHHQKSPRFIKVL